MELLKKALHWILIAVGAVYLLICILIFVYPQLFFYAPSSVRSDINNAHRYGYKAREVTYNSKDGTHLLAWYTKPRNGQNKVIVFMHGNSYNIEDG